MAALALLGSLALTARPGPARADSPLWVRVAVIGPDGAPQCPSPQELMAALRRALLTSDTIVLRVDSDSEVVLRDLGPEFVVGVAGHRRRFSNPLRTCSERARIAAVFASLALHPPGLSALPELAPEAAAAAPPPASGLTALLEAAGLFGVAAGAAEPLFTGGGAVRLYLGRSTIGAGVGLHGLAPQTQRFAVGSAQVLLFPVDLSLQLRRPGPRVEVAGEAGVLLSPLRIDAAPDPVGPPGASALFAPAEPVLRLDVGLRLAIDLRSWVSPRVAPNVGIDAWLWPRPYQLVVDPRGVVAERPWLAIMARVGISIRLR